MDNYYYAVGGQQLGPIPETELDQMVGNGQLSPETLIWKDGMSTWEAYSQRRTAGVVTEPTAATGPGPTRLTVAGASSSSSTEDTVTCGVCKQNYPRNQVIQYGTVPVCANCKPTFVQSLREGVVSTGALNYATFGQRFAAKFLDGIIIFVIQMIVGFATASLAGPGDGSSALGTFLSILMMFFGVFYAVFFLTKFNATPGKMAMKLRVVTPEGEPIGFKKALIRSLMEIVSGLILYIGYIMAAFDDEKRALHDRVASTRVIRTEK